MRTEPSESSSDASNHASSSQSNTLDAKLGWPPFSIGWRLARKALGFRGLMDVISPEGNQLVKGSHGRVTDDPRQGPLFISSEPSLAGSGTLPATEVAELMLSHVFG